ncbi:MAG: bifunctional DNA-binding transcriptional regulator/O6-methylguanine-DNA methyltransferase Ada, partial [Gemmatimonadetes bacterium]|nr:bifunctional DNA-binding transcriptional regulator/O6-methylguanine-DNA methyltransferase Ada [Gemmatimonadota bacterium]
MSPDLQWRAVAARDRRFDGAFVYAVRSTGVYCRPSCASRRPRRERVTFFTRPTDAERAGYRPCRRCHPRDAKLGDREVSLTVRVCRAIETARNGRLTLDALSRMTGMPPARLQRTFARVVGVSPRKYAEAYRMDRMKGLLQHGESITGALYAAGYGSPSRVYGNAERLGMTPGEYRNRGAAVTIRFTTVATSLGRLLVAATDRGVCAVKLGNSDDRLIAQLKAEFDAAETLEDGEALQGYAEALRRHVDQHQPTPNLPLDVQATAFQAKVWEVLRKIPYGETRSYGEVARAAGRPGAVRAVARACATNPAALVIPCHRVLRADGDLGGYRWGIERKQKLIEGERGAG